MTNQIQRPSDEVTCRVLIKWKGVDVPTTPTTYRGYLIQFNPMGMHPYTIKDPRDDTDTAHELLEHILSIVGKDACLLGGSGTGWMIMYDYEDTDEQGFWPLKTSKVSGEQFRYAVVELAAEVMT